MCVGFLSKQKVSIPRLKQKQKEWFPGVLIKTKSYKFGQNKLDIFNVKEKIVRSV